MSKYKQGFYKPINPGKYKGNVNQIVYRSGWELKAMRYFDTTSSVIAWGSEELVIPYFNQVDRRMHRYFPDFIIQVKGSDGLINTYVIEIKPAAQTVPPIKPTSARSKKRYISEVLTYQVNMDKWKAATEFCRQKNMKFKILTEKELFS